MPPRFVIRRKSVKFPSRSPWSLKDRQRLSFLGQYARLDLALAAIVAKLREERGAASVIFDDPSDHDEILAAMRKRREAREFQRHVNSPCMVEIPQGFDDVVNGVDS